MRFHPSTWRRVGLAKIRRTRQQKEDNGNLMNVRNKTGNVFFSMQIIIFLFLTKKNRTNYLRRPTVDSRPITTRVNARDGLQVYIS